ncbi:hypothetical protein Tco_0189779 [Tanacetum coccineum]
MIGSLLYLTASRPDIMFSVCLCARFQEDPKTSHLEAVKRIFRYVKGTMHLGLWYPKGSGIETIVYADSDHAGDYVDQKSTSGICTFMGCCLTSWFSKKQTALAISTTEAEYVSAGKACQQALWMKQALIDYGIRIKSARATPKAHLPYGMFLTRLFRHVMEHYPHLDNGIYNDVDHVMRPLALKQTRKPQSDCGKARYSVSSTSAHHNRRSSSHQDDDDDEDYGASRASTPSPTTYLNSLGPLDYQQYDVPTSSKQNEDLLFERQTDLLNQTKQMHKELRGGFKSFGKALQGVFRKKKK